MQSQFRRNLVGWSVLITALLLVVGAMIYHTITELIEDTAQVAHTHTVISTTAEIFSLAKDVETGQRGYVITGQDQYLEPYYTALPLLEQHLARLKTLTADNASQQERLAALEKAIKTRLSLAKTTIDLRRRQGFASAQRMVLGGGGKREMDLIRAHVARIEEEERRLLQQRSEKVQATSRLALGAGGGGLLVVVGIVFFMLGLVRRENQRRMEIEAGLETANSQLHHSLSAMDQLTREMTLIATLAEMLQSCRTVEEAYNVIRQTLPQVLPQATATLGVINASQNLVEVVLQIPEAGKTAEQGLFSPAECWALRRGHTHIVQDASLGLLCPHVISAASKADDGNGTPPGSTLCLPLMAHGETLGVLTVGAEQSGAFSEADQRAAGAIAEHVSLALANLQLQETLRTQSIRDPLSGLFNRRYLEVSFEREIARARRHSRPLSVMMIDIDFFKKFNDSLGHEAGDELLKAFGEFLQSQCRGEDIACRYGGEEFTLILPDAPLEVAHERAEQLRAGASRLQVEYRRERLPVITISAGVAAFPIHGNDKEELMRAADAALYRAKKEGRDRVIIAQSPAET